MILLIYLIWLLSSSSLIIANAANDHLETQSSSSTMVSLRVFGNGSVQVANITPNYQQTTTTTMPPIIDTQQMEQERILARERYAILI